MNNEEQTPKPPQTPNTALTFTTDLGAKVTIHCRLEDTSSIQETLGKHYGWTSTTIPPGGLFLPYDLEENFNWALIGGRRTEHKGEAYVIYQGTWYKRRPMEAVEPSAKLTNGLPAAVKYSRGARPYDPPEMVENPDEVGMVPLITFRGGGAQFKQNLTTLENSPSTAPPSGTPIGNNMAEISFITDLGAEITVSCRLSEVPQLQVTLAEQGWTSARIPPGGIFLPYDLEENFNWALLGARRAEFGGDIKVLHRGYWYTRRPMEAVPPTKKHPNGLPAMIKYSRGARPHDPREMVENPDEVGMVPLITFRGGGAEYKKHLSITREEE